MLCQKCNKNEATYHYTSNINGSRTQLHLCPECAAKDEYKSIWNDRLFAFSGTDGMNSVLDSFFRTPARRMFSSLFDSGFLGGRLFPELPDIFDDPFFRALDAAPAETEKQESRQKEQQAKSEAPTLSEREQLKMQLDRAVEREEYEEAAKLRDKIRALDSKGENRGEASPG